MKALQGAMALRALREKPMWHLLAAHRAPAIVAVLQSLFMNSDSVLESSVLLERLTRDLDQLRTTGEELTGTPQALVAEWVAEGWLTRRFPAGSTEEVFELSVDALAVIRFLAGQLKPRTLATESRLSLVIQQLVRLAAETDDNVQSRLATLAAERQRIEREMSMVESQGVEVLPAANALERAREVISLADELTADFRAVRDEFDRLNRGLRQSLVENEGSRGDVLEALFAGVDVIGESEAGRTFDAFWRLLTDGEQSAALGDSLEAITSRPFSRELTSHERRFLRSLTRVLLDEGRGVHEVMQNFARSLKSFVQSREFLEQRRLHQLLRQANQVALALKDQVRANVGTGYELALTSSRIRSLSQWTLYDPSTRSASSTMEADEPAEFDLNSIAEMVRQAEIDFRGLRAHIRALLGERGQVSIKEVLEQFPAEQGLGSVLGYVYLGSRHGEVTTASERLHWTGGDGRQRSATVPAVFFTQDRIHELAD